MHAPMFSSTASGLVKSITTSTLRRRSGVSAPASLLSRDARTCTLWSRARATSSTSDPVLPRPRSRRFIWTSGENRGIRIGEKHLMKCSHSFVYIVFFDHEADVDLRRSLRNHANVRFWQHAENLCSDAACATDIFTNQADDRFASFILHVRQLFQVGGDCWNRLGGIDCERDTHF